jgi:hypothetical protein
VPERQEANLLHQRVNANRQDGIPRHRSTGVSCGGSGLPKSGRSAFDTCGALRHPGRHHDRGPHYFRVARTVDVEWEMELPFAALHVL